MSPWARFSDLRRRNRRPRKLEGAIELRTSTLIKGWARDAARPKERLRLVARLSGRIVAETTADLYRADIEAAGVGDGRYAFELRFAECDVGSVVVETEDTRQIVPALPSAVDATPVRRGADGWLFLRMGANQAERFFTEPDYFSAAEIAAWRALLLERRERLHARGVAYFHTLAPDKITIYPDKYGAPLDHFDARPSRTLEQALIEGGCGDLYIDLCRPLAAERGKTRLYWKTDSHWTLAGAVTAARAVCRAMGLVPPDFTRRLIDAHDQFLDLGGKLDPPVSEKVPLFGFVEPAAMIYANELVALAAEGPRAGLLHGSHVVYRNERALNDQTLALFGDSFCEIGPWLLTAALAQVFREVHFMWSNAIDFSYVEEIRPHIVLTEIAERFVKRLPDDSRDLRAFARERCAARRAEEKSQA